MFVAFTEQWMYLDLQKWQKGPRSPPGDAGWMCSVVENNKVNYSRL